MRVLRLVLVEDQGLMLRALAALLALEPDFEIVGCFADGRAALAGIETLAPDVVLSDVEMPGGGGLDLVEALRRSGNRIPVLMLSTFGRSGYVERALDLGARGYLLKDTPPERLTAAIRAVAAGLTQIDAGLLDALDRKGRPLTERERVLARFVREGLTNPEIADALGLAPGTVRNAVSELIAKLGARNRTDAVRIAADEGWL